MTEPTLVAAMNGSSWCACRASSTCPRPLGFATRWCELWPRVEGPPRVVVDLGGLDFLDSTGLGVLLGAVKRVRGQGGALALCRAEPQVRKVFEVTHVIEILPIHDDVTSAVASVRGA